MPQLLPTVDDLRKMTPRQRERAAKAIRAVLDETDAFIAEHLPGVALSREQREDARRAIWSVMQVAEAESPDKVGQRIRARARLREAQTRQEPAWVTAARREALLEAVNDRPR
jgi:ClpP class serine protease